MRWSLLFVFFVFVFSEGRTQLTIGAGAAIHRYDQVICVKGQKPVGAASLGLDLGLGVERSLQGALAPQVAFYYQRLFANAAPQKLWKHMFWSTRFQLDWQQSSMMDVKYAYYLGLGYAFGKKQHIDLQLTLGGVYEQWYGAKPSALPSLPLFLNPQLQLNYYLSK